jgi:hypothetical protein
MYVEGGWKPPWEPPSRPRLTKRQQTVLLWIVALNALALFLAPIGSATLVEALVKLVTG